MRRGKEFYSKYYKQVNELYSSGMSINAIANKLGISYSCIYHWVKGLRKPKAGNVASFEALLISGPQPAAEIKNQFPKHNELFHISARRGLPVKRFVMDKKFKDYAVWYFIDGQEDILKCRVKDFLLKYKEVKKKIIEILNYLEFTVRN